MDILALLRDPVWQAIGAILTAVGLVVTLLLSARGRKWLAGLVRMPGRSVSHLLAKDGVKILLYAMAFIIPIPTFDDFEIQLHLESQAKIVASLSFLLLITGLIIDYRHYQIKLFLSDKILLVVLSLAYMIPKLLYLYKRLRPSIPPAFLAFDVHLLIMLLTFMLMQQMWTLARDIRDRKKWSEPLWEHQKATTEQLSKVKSSLDEVTQSLEQFSTKVSQLQMAQTPREKRPPQWWQVVEDLKKREPYVPVGNTSYSLYHNIVKCDHQIDRENRSLTIILPKGFTDGRDGYAHTIVANEIVIEAGRMFEGYAVNWKVEEE